MFKVRHSELPAYFIYMSKINSDVLVCITRHLISLSGTNIFKNTIRNAGPVLWNNESNFNMLSTIDIFNRAYKQYVLTEN